MSALCILGALALSTAQTASVAFALLAPSLPITLAAQAPSWNSLFTLAMGKLILLFLAIKIRHWLILAGVAALDLVLLRPGMPHSKQEWQEQVPSQILKISLQIQGHPFAQTVWTLFSGHASQLYQAAKPCITWVVQRGTPYFHLLISSAQGYFIHLHPHWTHLQYQFMQYSTNLYSAPQTQASVLYAKLASYVPPKFFSRLEANPELCLGLAQWTLAIFLALITRRPTSPSSSQSENTVNGSTYIPSKYTLPALEQKVRGEPVNKAHGDKPLSLTSAMEPKANVHESEPIPSLPLLSAPTQIQPQKSLLTGNSLPSIPPTTPSKSKASSKLPFTPPTSRSVHQKQDTASIKTNRSSLRKLKDHLPRHFSSPSLDSSGKRGLFNSLRAKYPPSASNSVLSMSGSVDASFGADSSADLSIGPGPTPPKNKRLSRMLKNGIKHLGHAQ